MYILYSTCCRCLIPGKHSEMDYAVAFYVSHAVNFLNVFQTNYDYGDDDDDDDYVSGILYSGCY